MGRLLLSVVAAAGALLLVGLGLLLEAHMEIRRLDPELPTADHLARLDAAGGPVRLGYLDTATQASASGPPVGHPAFLLEWEDGRIFAIDVGMDRAGALAFGATLERLIGSDPIVPHGSLAEQLGPEAPRIAGVAFTHLHTDHTGGMSALCEAVGHSVPVFQTVRQAELGNYTTRPGRNDLARAPCARLERIPDGPMPAVPGFPGLYALEAGGHTPGSTVFVARMPEATFLFAGDVTNFRQALLEDRPKPRAYSLLVTPEAPKQLAALRQWLRGLDAAPGFHAVVSHDVESLPASGVAPWQNGKQ